MMEAYLSADLGLSPLAAGSSVVLAEVDESGISGSSEVVVGVSELEGFILLHDTGSCSGIEHICNTCRSASVNNSKNSHYSYNALQ